jgi:hypothetical protein
LQWFYNRNDGVAPLPLFSDRMIEVLPPMWMYGPLEKDKKWLSNLLGAIGLLKECGLCGASVIGVYHMRRMVPLITHAL